VPSSQRSWDAEDYAAHSVVQLEWALELIEKLSLRGDESLLDIGCGDGKISALLAEALPTGKVLGVDVSAEMIDLASRRFIPGDHPNLTFQRMDACRIELPRTFDVAFSTAALHWVEDHRAVLRGVRACLRPGGRILFQMGGRGNAEEMLRTVEDTAAGERWRGFFGGFNDPYHLYGPDEYEAWLAETGFRLERAELVPKDMQQEGPEGLAGWLRTTWFPYTDPLPPELRGEFLAEVVAAFEAEHPADARGRIHVGMVRLEVEARVV
jgi:trans-aconitate 2-methyltransferase